MDLGVFGEVVAAGKLFLAQGALIGFDAGMRAAVTGQLIRPGEPPSTVRPATCVWFLSSVTTEVRFQVAALGVHLPTAGVGALMDPLCSGHSGHTGGHGFQHTIPLAPHTSDARNLHSPHCDGQGSDLDVLLVG